MKSTPSSGLLRYALKANATFSALSGVLLSFVGSRIASWLGFHPPLALWPVGLALLGFAAYVFVIARKSESEIRTAQAIIIADALWVFGSMALIPFGPLSARGNAAIAVVALVVLSFAVLQGLGIRRLRR